MTERKPMGLSFDSWIDRQIDASMKRGEMDHLPGKGKPLPGVNGRYDPDWWLKEKLQRENLDLTPETIVSRRKVEVWMESYLALSSAAQVRRQADALNKVIQAANKTDLGPHLPQQMLDVDALIRTWLDANSSG
ncbi:MAG: DUF1992 domain-containing protein [Myxococcota bacterium]|nr:DUF1992 domain-containing protein [Myxococcota bacterium]